MIIITTAMAKRGLSGLKRWEAGIYRVNPGLSLPTNLPACLRSPPQHCHGEMYIVTPKRQGFCGHLYLLETFPGLTHREVFNFLSTAAVCLVASLQFTAIRAVVGQKHSSWSPNDPRLQSAVNFANAHTF